MSSSREVRFSVSVSVPPVSVSVSVPGDSVHAGGFETDWIDTWHMSPDELMEAAADEMNVSVERLEFAGIIEEDGFHGLLTSRSSLADVEALSEAFEHIEGEIVGPWGLRAVEGFAAHIGNVYPVAQFHKSIDWWDEARAFVDRFEGIYDSAKDYVQERGPEWLGLEDNDNAWFYVDEALVLQEMRHDFTFLDLPDGGVVVVRS